MSLDVNVVEGAGIEPLTRQALPVKALGLLMPGPILGNTPNNTSTIRAGLLS